MFQQVALGETLYSKSASDMLGAEHIAAGIVVVAFDAAVCVGGMAYIALPDSSLASVEDRQHTGKYADLAIPAFLQGLQSHGASLERLRIKMVGGVQLFKFGGGGGSLLNIGTRNAVSIRTGLLKKGLTIEKTDTGGNKAKQVRLDMKTGAVFVANLGEPEQLL